MANPRRQNQPPPPQQHQKDDPFLAKFSASELRTAAEYFSDWLPFLSRGLCRLCTNKLSQRIQSLDPTDANDEKLLKQEGVNHVVSAQNYLVMNGCNGSQDSCDTHLLGSCKDGDANDNGSFVPGSEMQTEGEPFMTSETPSVKMSWADVAQKDEDLEVEEEEGIEVSSRQMENGNGNRNVAAETEEKPKPQLSAKQRELIRFNNVVRKKDYECIERIRGKSVNILDGLELHEHIFSAVEQNRIVADVERLQEEGREGKLRGRTFSAPNKWMKGKGRITMQFGCCYNYASDEKGNRPGILPNELAEPIPPLIKGMIKRLVRWHVLPPSCVPDSCIVNVYDVGDCIPPHIDNHDFLRPFCTVSFLSECKILFGSKLKIDGPGEFSGSYDISLPVGSVLVLKGNGADVAKHCVPAVPQKRISITFRKMDATNCPRGFAPEPDLRGLRPLGSDVDTSRNTRSTRPLRQ